MEAPSRRHYQVFQMPWAKHRYATACLSWSKAFFVLDSCFFRGGATVVSFLLLSGDFPARRLLLIEPHGLSLCLPREVLERGVIHDEPEGVAVRGSSVQHRHVIGFSPTGHWRAGFGFDP